MGWIKSSTPTLEEEEIIHQTASRLILGMGVPHIWSPRSSSLCFRLQERELLSMSHEGSPPHLSPQESPRPVPSPSVHLFVNEIQVCRGEKIMSSSYASCTDIWVGDTDSACELDDYSWSTQSHERIWSFLYSRILRDLDIPASKE